MATRPLAMLQNSCFEEGIDPHYSQVNCRAYGVSGGLEQVEGETIYQTICTRN